FFGDRGPEIRRAVSHSILIIVFVNCPLSCCFQLLRSSKIRETLGEINRAALECAACHLTDHGLGEEPGLGRDVGRHWAQFTGLNRAKANSTKTHRSAKNMFWPRGRKLIYGHHLYATDSHIRPAFPLRLILTFDVSAALKSAGTDSTAP